MARYARDVTLYENPCTGLVPLIEAGELASAATRALLQACVEPMLQGGVDTLVLGCTHYPFVLPLIQEIAGPAVQIIDPAPAVARQTQRVLEENSLLAHEDREGSVRAYTSGDPRRLAQLIPQLLGYALPVEGLMWRGERLFPLS